MAKADAYAVAHGVPSLQTQMHEREAFRAIFSFGGTIDGLNAGQVSGLDGASPFTHLAPVAATFHPLMAEMADATRLQGLPVFVTHGKLDWMFPVQTARQTQAALSAAGAQVTYREIDDLSHTYPREINAELMKWLNGE